MPVFSYCHDLKLWILYGVAVSAYKIKTVWFWWPSWCLLADLNFSLYLKKKKKKTNSNKTNTAQPECVSLAEFGYGFALCSVIHMHVSPHQYIHTKCLVHCVPKILWPSAIGMSFSTYPGNRSQRIFQMVNSAVFADCKTIRGERVWVPTMRMRICKEFKCCLDGAKMWWDDY